MAEQAVSLVEVARTWDRFAATCGHTDLVFWKDLSEEERQGAAATYDDMQTALLDQFEDVPF